MAQDRRSLRVLAKLLPSGALGLSATLASADASALSTPVTDAPKDGTVSERLNAIRQDVSGALEQYRKDGEPFVAVDPEQQLAWWGNGGWRNGGWHNWGNGWHNGGWGNGGWHNWGNGWHNGWHNW